MEHSEKQPTLSSISNVEPNVSAAFAYLLPPISGIIFFLMERKNKFVRFHAMQSILIGIFYIAFHAIFSSYYLYFFESIFRLVYYVLVLFLVWKAYQNEEYHVPFIGKIAKDYSNKPQTPQHTHE